MFDLAAALGTGQPFLGHAVKRQCGVLLIAAEGADEVRLRLDAVVRAKCGDMQRAPFRWYETAPMLLQKGCVETLIAMARQADASLQQEFGLPLGLIIIDTIAACAGYARAGDENDPAVGQAVMNVLKAVAQAIELLRAGRRSLRQEPRGRHPRRLQQGERPAIWCWPAWATRSSAAASSTHGWRCASTAAAGRGRNIPFTLRMVEAPEPDEDGEPITTMVVDWQPPAPPGGGAAAAGSVGAVPAPGSAHGGAAAEAGADGRSWPIRVSICRSRRTGRWCA